MAENMETLKDQEQRDTKRRAAAPSALRAYQPPTLARLGRVAELTHGPSFGLNESGNPTLFKV